MKKNRKIYGVLLALIMVASLVSTVFAEDEDQKEEPSEIIAVQELLVENTDKKPAEDPTEEPVGRSAKEPGEMPAEEPAEDERVVHIDHEVISEGPLTYGSMVRFYATLSGFENEEEVSFQWQFSVDGEEWSNVENGNESELIIAVDSSNARLFWRVVVTGK